MRVKHAIQDAGDVVVVDLSGNISPGNTLADRHLLHDLVGEQLQAGHRKVLLSLREVHYMDSSGLGDLIAALRLAQSQRADLRVCNLTERVANLLSRTQLDSVIRCYGDEGGALQAFSGGDAQEKSPAA